MSNTFGQRLRQLRKQAGISQRDLAQQVMLDFTYLSKIENDRLEYLPSRDAISRIAQVLHADEGELLRLADKKDAIRIEQLEQQVKRYHAALNNVLALFISFDGWDYSCVDDALKVLAENVDALPTRVAIVERIRQRMDVSHEQ